MLPTDIVAAATISEGAPRSVVPADQIPPGWLGLDIGPRTAQLFAARLAGVRTAFWNGPMGVFESEPFAAGTVAMARGLIDSGAYTVISGGATTAAVRALGFSDRDFGYLSTGGGASLAYLQGAELPGLAVLQETTSPGMTGPVTDGGRYRWVLLRHGESEWNARNLFTGWVNAALTPRGEREARRAGQRLARLGLLPGLHTSVQRRAIRTAELALADCDRDWIPVRRSWRLNSNHYGGLQGRDKDQVRQAAGEQQFMAWRCAVARVSSWFRTATPCGP